MLDCFLHMHSVDMANDKVDDSTHTSQRGNSFEQNSSSMMSNFLRFIAIW